MRVVFDTNVVASGSFWRGKPFDCLVAWAEGQCEAVVSPALKRRNQAIKSPRFQVSSSGFRVEC